MEKSFDIRLIIKSFRDFWWQILLIGLVVAIAFGGVMILTEKDEYQSTFSLMIINRNNNDFTQASVVEANPTLGEIHVKLSKSDEVIDAIVDYMKHALGYESVLPSSVRGAMQITSDATGTLTYTVVTNDAQKSYDIARAAKAVIPNILTNGFYRFNIESLDTPTKASSPISHSTTIYLVLGFAVGAFITWLISFIKNVINPTVLSKKDITDEYKYPVIGYIPKS